MTKASLLGWLGESISVYADPDPFWAELGAAMKALEGAKPGERPASDKFFEDNLHRLPVAFTAEVSNGLKLTLFLSGIRAFIQQTAPGMVEWESFEHNGQHYVKITPTETSRPALHSAASKLAIHYAATPGMLVVTLNEDLLKRALDRQAARKKEAQAKDAKPASGAPATDAIPAGDPPRPWLGKSMAFQIDRKVLELFEEVFGRRAYQGLMQSRAWSNIAILNEWQRLYPDHDPLAVHQQVWQTALVCPGGGKYVWNPEFQTMESTVYGHPGQPKTGPAFPQPLVNVQWLDFGLTFENRGLRAQAEIRRHAGK